MLTGPIHFGPCTSFGFNACPVERSGGDLNMSVRSLAATLSTLEASFQIGNLSNRLLKKVLGGMPKRYGTPHRLSRPRDPRDRFGIPWKPIRVFQQPPNLSSFAVLPAYGPILTRMIEDSDPC